MSTLGRLLVGMALVASVAACGVTSPSDLTSQTWTGSVSPGGTSSQFNFSTSKTGEFIVKITAESPDSGAALLIEYGTPQTASGIGGCGVISGVPGYQGTTPFDIQLPKGDFCMIATDAGSLTRTETFTATVSHL
jgi:hypothetical protein